MLNHVTSTLFTKERRLQSEHNSAFVETQIFCANFSGENQVPEKGTYLKDLFGNSSFQSFHEFNDSYSFIWLNKQNIVVFGQTARKQINKKIRNKVSRVNLIGLRCRILGILIKLHWTK